MPEPEPRRIAAGVPGGILAFGQHPSAARAFPVIAGMVEISRDQSSAFVLVFAEPSPVVYPIGVAPLVRYQP